MSPESEPAVDPDTPPATPDEVQPSVDPERRWTRPKSRNVSIPIVRWIPWRTGDPSNLMRAP